MKDLYSLLNKASESNDPIVRIHAKKGLRKLSDSCAQQLFPN